MHELFGCFSVKNAACILLVEVLELILEFFDLLPRHFLLCLFVFIIAYGLISFLSIANSLVLVIHLFLQMLLVWKFLLCLFEIFIAGSLICIRLSSLLFLIDQEHLMIQELQSSLQILCQTS